MIGGMIYTKVVESLIIIIIMVQTKKWHKKTKINTIQSPQELFRLGHFSDVFVIFCTTSLSERDLRVHPFERRLEPLPRQRAGAYDSCRESNVYTYSERESSHFASLHFSYRLHVPPTVPRWLFTH